MQWNIDDLPMFIAVVDHKGFSAAADYLGISKSAVSKALQRLEGALGVRLLERNSRNIRITSEGEAFYRQGVLIMDQVNEANHLMSGLTSKPRGRLVVSLPVGFTREIIAPRLGEFHETFPEIELEVVITSHPVDIIRDQIDIAVVVGVQNNSELIVRTLYESRLTCVASPAYVKANKLDDSTDSLASHIKICETRYATQRFPILVGGQKKIINLKSDVIQVNDPTTVREAVLHGCGVGLIPNQYCKKLVASKQLVQVFSNISFELSMSVVSATYPSRRLISNKTRAFLEFLIKICRDI